MWTRRYDEADGDDEDDDAAGFDFFLSYYADGGPGSSMQALCRVYP